MYITVFLKDAKKFGMDEAYLLMYLRSELLVNEKRKQNYHKGRYWVHGTYESLTADLQIYSREQVKRLFDKLIKLGVVIKDRFNDDPWDRSNWYTINSENFSVPL